MNEKGCGLIKILSGICLEDLRETMEKNSFNRIVDVPSEILTKHLPNTSQEHQATPTRLMSMI
jgi:hypothetical protein